VRRRVEPEGNGVADIQVADIPARSLNLSGLGHDIPDRVDEAADAPRYAYGMRGSSRHCTRILPVNGPRAGFRLSL